MMADNIAVNHVKQQSSTLEKTATSLLSAFQFSQLSGQQQSLVNEFKAQLDEQNRVINRLGRINKINRYFVVRLRSQVIHNPDDPLGSIITDLDRYRVLVGRIQRQHARVPLPSPVTRRDPYEILYDLIATLPSTKTKTIQRTSGRPRGRPRGSGRARSLYSHNPASTTPAGEVNSIESNLNDNNISRVRKSRQLAETRLQSLNAALKSIPHDDDRKRRKVPKKKATQNVQKSNPSSHQHSAETLAKAKERLEKKKQTASWTTITKKKADTNISSLPQQSTTKSRPRSSNEQKTDSMDSMFKPIYVCNMDDECRYETSDELELKDHQRNSTRHQTSPPYTCHVCREVFHDLAAHKDHRLIYHQLTDVLYRCSLCPFAKPFMERLRMHYKSHTAQPNIKCIWPGCEKMFRFKGNLAEHVKMHENGRNYKCSQCSYSCNTSCNLRKHVLVHERRRTASAQRCPEPEQGASTAEQSMPMITPASYDSPNSSMLLGETETDSMFYSHHQGSVDLAYVNSH